MGRRRCTKARMSPKKGGTDEAKRTDTRVTDSGTEGNKEAQAPPPGPHPPGAPPRGPPLPYVEHRRHTGGAPKATQSAGLPTSQGVSPFKICCSTLFAPSATADTALPCPETATVHPNFKAMGTKR